MTVNVGTEPNQYSIPVDLRRIANAIEGTPAQTYTQAIAPSASALASGQNLLVAAPDAGNRLRLVAVGFQNRGTTTRTLTLKHGATAVRIYTLVADATLEIGSDECLAWDFAAEEAFDADASAGSDLFCTGGRYYVEAA